MIEMTNMDLQQLHTVLEETFAANFVAYYRTHVAHINIKGRTFYQDHKLLQKIYEYLQANIDTLGEKIRSTRAYIPASLQTVVGISPLLDMDCSGSARDMLNSIEEVLEALIDQYHLLNAAAEDVNYVDISNYAQDQIGQIAKWRWMIEATLDERDESEDY
jgi:DNA-binding ferritin-like protein